MKNNPANPLISLSGVTLRLADRWVVRDVEWSIREGENWVIWGANGAGKTTLARALLGEAAVVRGRIRRHYREGLSPDAPVREVVMVSGDDYHHLLQREQFLDEMRTFSGRIGETTSVADLFASLPVPDVSDPIGAVLVGDQLLAKPLTALSAGEMRRVLIARALRRNPFLLVLDEPFNGLDAAARAGLTDILETLSTAGVRMVLISHRLSEIPACFTHLLQIEQGRVVWQGARADFAVSETSSASADVVGQVQWSVPAGETQPTRAEGEALIRMRGVTVRYGTTVVLDGIDWSVRQGEHWALVGPNGAGKTTLLNLISGENPQGYANALEIFGLPRGPQLPLWQLRSAIALVDDHLQARFQRRISGLEVVCSGFFDSIGLYRRSSARQRRLARQWIDRLGLAGLADRPMTGLSFGQQRMLLIARCMVKAPRLLILDEPCNGLDPGNRRRLLALLDRIGQASSPALLYVTHRRDELPTCITHCLYIAAGRVVRAGPVSRV